MASKSIMLDLDDDRIGKIADVISNKTAKKILSILSERELSEGTLSKELGVPANTINYNIKKLESIGLIEKSGKFFWSVKGKKVPVYRVANRKVVITPKSGIRGVLPAVLISAFAAVGIKAMSLGRASISFVENSVATSETYGAVSPVSDMAVGKASGIVAGGMQTASSSGSVEVWAWFLLGALFGLLIHMIFNWRNTK